MPGSWVAPVGSSASLRQTADDDQQWLIAVTSLT